MPGVHCPVYAYTDIPAAATDRLVTHTPLHSLHNASLLPDNDAVYAAQDVDYHVLSMDKHLSMLLEGCTFQQRLRVQVLLDTGASRDFASLRLLQQLDLSFQPY